MQVGKCSRKTATSQQDTMMVNPALCVVSLLVVMGSANAWCTEFADNGWHFENKYTGDPLLGFIGPSYTTEQSDCLVDSSQFCICARLWSDNPEQRMKCCDKIPNAYVSSDAGIQEIGGFTDVDEVRCEIEAEIKANWLEQCYGNKEIDGCFCEDSNGEQVTVDNHPWEKHTDSYIHTCMDYSKYPLDAVAYDSLSC